MKNIQLLKELDIIKEYEFMFGNNKVGGVVIKKSILHLEDGYHFEVSFEDGNSVKWKLKDVNVSELESLREDGYLIREGFNKYLYIM